MNYSDAYLQDAYDNHSIHNRGAIEASQDCGCFSCMAVFPSRHVWEWVPSPVREQDTAFCPYCTFDAVIGDCSSLPVTSDDFLRALNKLIFGGPTRFDQAKNPQPRTLGIDWKNGEGTFLFAPSEPE